MTDRKPAPLPRVVIIGGGFGGLTCARALRRAPVSVTLVDRSNHHLFQPLLYQVATGGLSPANIAAPLRSIFHRQQNATVLQGEVVGFNLPAKRVLLADGTLNYDWLVVATGATHSYFGKDEWAPAAPGLKTLDDATDIRARVLRAFEQAERIDDLQEQRRLLTFVVVGAGPTGVELAGALAELSRHTLKGDFRRINPADARLVLIEAGPRVLGPYDPTLSAKAAAYLHRLGVTVLTQKTVTRIDARGVVVRDAAAEEAIPAATVLWAAGVQSSPLAQRLAEAAGLETDRAGRVPVGADLSLGAHANVLVLGDMASCVGKGGKPLPGVAPVAIQQGSHAAAMIRRRLRSQPSTPFRYYDYGSMATIGRSAAVVSMGRLKFAGYFAWLTWLFVHLMQLVSFENRVLVLFQWAWSYLTRGRSAWLITGKDTRPTASAAAPSPTP
ncbi:NAD(P)/FAD-dependent oxidoreductase [Botrimarina hoheduenensis]|uniref:NAD(P)/FAD-dependent oxidoreductase n=1 Tax=Botrimarina hoheduenensis TaxID=2528000 RepID=UPI0011B4F08A|nr:NAD(P)/FAD-dependent oxidoreductase [Botrimarina hoheduenensis]